MALTYWEINLAGDLYNTNLSGKVGINNHNPVLELDVIGSIGTTSLLEFKKTGSDVVQLKSSSVLGYDFVVWNATKSAYRLFISSSGKVALGTNAATSKLTVVETTSGNAWAAASFTNTSTVGFGIEVTGGNEDNSTAVFKNYANVVGATISGRGELFVRDWITSNAGTSVSGKHHFRMENDHLRFSFLLEDNETGVGNTGSNFVLNRYNDAGESLGNVIKIIRSSGNITFTGNAVLNDNLTVLGTLFANNTNIPLRLLSDVSSDAHPNIEGGILRVVNGEWNIADVSTLPQPDLSQYLTKQTADSYYTSISAFNSHTNNLNNPHQTSLQEVLTVNNSTSLPILTDSYIYAGSIILGDVVLEALEDTLTITGNLNITGNVSFDGETNLYLYNLTDVGDSVRTAPDGYILKKVNGIWNAVQDNTNIPIDLSNYYTKEQSDSRFVNVTGDSMTGMLSIVTAGTALSLEVPVESDSIKILTTGNSNPAMIVKTSSSGSSIVFRDGDSFKLTTPSLGDILTIDDNGSVVFGDSTKSSSTLGTVTITSLNPSLTLSKIGQNGGFKIVNHSAYSEILQNGSRVVSFNGDSNPNVELFYGNSRKLHTTSYGVEIFNTLAAESLKVSDLPIYKSQDGKLVIDADVVITGNYLEEWSSPGTGKSPGVNKFVELEDVSISSIESIPSPFILGRNSSSGKIQYLTADDAVSMLEVVTKDELLEHTSDNLRHVNTQNRINWTLASDNISKIFDWDLIYSTHSSKEVGLSDTEESGTAISTIDMKYLFYWTDVGGDKVAVKTKFADNADKLHNKPWDEFRYSRAVGSTLLNADSLYGRGLYDLGTVRASVKNVPKDGSWQVETIDSSYLFNQQGADIDKHKYQLATQWIDRDTSFDLWARGRDGVSQRWLPWVQFMHTGNTPGQLDLYPSLPDEAYDELENEDNWTYRFSTPDDPYELYIGETEGIDWAFNIGHRVVNKQYIYEVTPIGIKRIGNSKYIVVEVSTTSTTTSFTISPLVDRYEITMSVASNDIMIIIDHKREKPIVISINNTTPKKASVYYTNESLPNTKLIELEPDVIIEVHPGIWQLN